MQHQAVQTVQAQLHDMTTCLAELDMIKALTESLLCRSGVADRGASIRIPLPVQLKGYGYLEDRRPSANVDPYTVARLLIKTCIPK